MRLRLDCIGLKGCVLDNPGIMIVDALFCVTFLKLVVQWSHPSNEAQYIA
jgi:hypothetical protein